jgi:ATP-dependent DNA helicase
MLLLNRLLDALFARKHKVLVFSQFTKQLDILEVNFPSRVFFTFCKCNVFPAPTNVASSFIKDWATSYKGWKICRIDGSTTQDRRRTQMKEFNEAGEEDGVCRLFLLSTRAGGLGINLVAADTVVFYDQDWNPQMDLQAQDRAHRSTSFSFGVDSRVGP